MSKCQQRHYVITHLIRRNCITTNRPWAMAFERIIRTQTTIIACQDGSSIIGRVALRIISYRTVQITAIKSARDDILVVIITICIILFVLLFSY